MKIQPKPLRTKETISTNSFDLDMKTIDYRKVSDIKSAVEWLKREIQEYKDLGINCHQDCINEINKIIDEAF